MLRIVLGVIAGPAFGVNQKAFEEAVKNGGPDASGFTADTTMLMTQLVLGIIVSVLAGALAALIAGENTRAPLFFGILLLAMGVMKAVMSWQYVPIWYHVIFTAILLPVAILGGKLITNA